MQGRGQTLIVAVLLGVVVSLWYYPWLDSRRWTAARMEPASDLVVTSAVNGGPGSLREAVFSATRADVAVTILIRTDEIVLETPLPPLISRFGLTVRSAGERSTIVAPAAYDLPVFDLRAGRTVIENLAIRSAPARAISIASREPAFVRNVFISGSDVAIGASGDYRLEVTGSELTDNRIGIELLGVGQSVVSDTRFAGHDDAGLWVVGLADSASGLPDVDVENSHFSGARYGIVAANAASRIHDNEISGFSGDGILMLGGAAEVAGNQIWSGAGAAIRSVGLTEGSITGNDLHENTAIGILLQASTSVQAEENRVYRNGYGIVTVQNRSPAAVTLRGNLLVGQNVDGVVAVGDSPAIADNRMLRNGAAGIRIFHLVLPDAYIRSDPFLAGNVLDDNVWNEPVFAEYYLPVAEAQ